MTEVFVRYSRDAPERDATAPDDLAGIPQLSIAADPGRHACRLRVAGTLDANSQSILAEAIDEWMARGPHHFVIDLTDVHAVDASGARALSRAAHVVGRANGSMTLIVPQRLLDGPLADCGIELVLPPTGAGAAVSAPLI